MNTIPATAARIDMFIITKKYVRLTGGDPRVKLMAIPLATPEARSKKPYRLFHKKAKEARKVGKSRSAKEAPRALASM